MIDPAPLTITADSTGMVYGGALPALTASYAGFVNGDSAASLTTPPTLATVPATSHVGSYAFSVSGAADPDYAITYVNGTLTISPAPLTITADSKTKVYGAALPPLTASSSGFVNGDTVAVLGGLPQLSTNATLTSPVGMYTIQASLGSLSAQDYTFRFRDGTLTVTPATPAVNVIGGSFLYDGQPHPATGSAVGVNGADLGTPLFTYTDSSGASVTASINPGTYQVAYQVVGSFSGNVNYTAASGTATVVILPSTTFAPPLVVGYWKNHPSAWPVKTLTLGGYTYSRSELLAILNNPHSDDARIILAQQLIAAKLNLANGSNPAPIRATMDYADSLLAGLGKITVTSRKVKVSSSLGQLMVHTAAVLDDYNQGLL